MQKITCVCFALFLLTVSSSADARYLSNAGVIMASSTNDLLTTPMAFVDAGRGDWFDGRVQVPLWVALPTMPFVGLAMVFTDHLVPWLSGIPRVLHEMGTFDRGLYVGNARPWHTDPKRIWVTESTVRPKCDWPWAELAPECLKR